MLWVKAFHIIAVICWMAALLYLPRLFVYHAMCDDNSSRERFSLMERKLYRAIATPAMLATLILGIALLHLQWAYLQASGWLWTKLALVVVLIAYHHICGAHIKRLASNSNRHSHKYFRVFNEIPAIVMIAIVILVVVKPF